MEYSHIRFPKILFLTAWYPNNTDSMFGLFVKKHAIAASRVASVFLIHACPYTTAGNKYKISHESKTNFHELIIYYPTKKSGGVGSFLNHFRWLRAYYKGYRFMKKEWGMPQATHVNILTRVGLLALILKIVHGIPYLITEHWSRYLNMYPSDVLWFHSWLTRLVIKKSSLFTVVSKKLGEAIKRQKLSDDYMLIGNVVETDLFKIIRKPALKPQKTIVHISCFEEKSKNLTGTIDAIKELQKLRNDFCLHMVGTGPDFSMAVNYAAKSGLNNNTIIFDGLKEDQELAEIIAKSDLTILFSHYETFGIVIYESLSCGVPVLVTNVADFKSILLPWSGRVVSDKSPESLAHAINEILDDADQFQPEKMRRFVMERFSEKAVSDKLLEYYKMIIF